MKKLLALLIAFSVKFSYAQLFVGGAYGTFNNPGSSYKFRGMGPTIMVDYVYDDAAALFLNASLYSKSIIPYSDHVYDENGVLLGIEKKTESYSYKYLQLGIKGCLAGDFSDSRVNWFMGGGGALGVVTAKDKFEMNGRVTGSDAKNYLLYGIHFNTGMQYRIQRVMIELKGNLDFSVKPIVASSEGGYVGAYVLSSLRMGVLVPLTKW